MIKGSLESFVDSGMESVEDSKTDYSSEMIDSLGGHSRPWTAPSFRAFAISRGCSSAPNLIFSERIICR
jgi:hypothetical protein